MAVWEKVCDAPDAVGRLRQFVLDLAVRGKLVDQLESEGSIRPLLQQAARNRSEAATTRGKRQRDRSEPVRPEECFVVAPETWEWVRLHDVGWLSGGMTPSMARPEFWNGDVPWMSPKDIKSSEVSRSELQVTRRAIDETGLLLFPSGSLLMVARSGILKRIFPVSIAYSSVSVNQDLKVLVPFLDGMGRFIQLLLQGCTEYILSNLVKTGTTVQSLKFDEFQRQPFPLPPLAEQNRIVAKVDELMALCNRLEAARAEREATRDRLAAASLARLNTPDPETFPADARFALDTLPAVTTRPDQIKQLRSSILALAIQGRLVEQVITDDPPQAPRPRSFAASSDFDRRVYVEELSSLVLPATWISAPLALMSIHIVDCPHTTPKWTASGKICVRTNQLSRQGLDLSAPRFVSPDEYIQRVERLEPRGGDILYSREGGILGVACVIPQGVQICMGQRLMLIRPGQELIPTFLNLVLNSPLITSIAARRTTGGAAPRVNMSTVRAYPIPVPPLAEQARIVAKVADFMSICDRLEASIVAGAEARRGLLEATLRDALAPAMELSDVVAA